MVRHSSLHKDEKPKALYHAFPLCWLAGDINQPTHFSQRVGNQAPSVVVWSSHCLKRPPYKPRTGHDKKSLTNQRNHHCRLQIYLVSLPGYARKNAGGGLTTKRRIEK